MLLLYLILLNLDWNMDTFVFISETALKLDSLVGEVEDAVSSAMSTNLKKNSIPQSLERIDLALAALRPQAIADHCTLLALLRWPPPLATLSSSNLDRRRPCEVLNPLSELHGELTKNLLQRISTLSVFCDRPDWRDKWAEIELGSVPDILKPEMEVERNWTIKPHGTVSFLGSEDYKSPGLAPNDESGKPFTEDSLFTGMTEGSGNGIRDYLKNRKQWQEKLEEGWKATPSLVVAMDYLQGKMSIIEQGLNDIDFAAVRRSLARGINWVIYTGILMNNAKFCGSGVERFKGDMDVLFGVFRTWCLRPEGFFPHISEGLKLLKMEENHLQDLFKQGEEWMKRNGIRHLSMAEAKKIARCSVSISVISQAKGFQKWKQMYMIILCMADWILYPIVRTTWNWTRSKY
ncbi:hypothetical protein Cgig2_028612 [Carnegiea gigantea]|uniref:Uncharacterized protein n=1 Tax=Carnegiea gigantea TaxID=171969 RepID=A0A9Q1K6D4_9CARY|nr:hypothetical protein Cgig2_028612 [Carnegiea gigantea]